MCDKNPRTSFLDFPSVGNFPECHLSLKMINTINAIPNQPSLDNLDIQVAPSLEEDSLAQRISHVQTAANSGKKRKMGCTCKKTFCLKMYCQCFSQGKKCGDDCACLNCKNAPGFQQLINNAKQGIKQGGSRSCRLSEKRCNCKKSHCLKRYCECFNAGVGCGEGCKCQGCQNKAVSQKEESEEQPEVEKEEVVEDLPVQFPSIGGYRSMEDLQRFYN